MNPQTEIENAYGSDLLYLVLRHSGNRALLEATSAVVNKRLNIGGFVALMSKLELRTPEDYDRFAGMYPRVFLTEDSMKQVIRELAHDYYRDYAEVGLRWITDKYPRMSMYALEYLTGEYAGPLFTEIFHKVISDCRVDGRWLPLASNYELRPALQTILAKQNITTRYENNILFIKSEQPVQIEGLTAHGDGLYTTAHVDQATVWDVLQRI